MNIWKRKTQRIGAMLLAAVFLLTSMPYMAFADLNPKKSANFKEGSKLTDSYGNYYHFGKDYLLEVWQYRNNGSRHKIILDNENREPKRSYMISQGGDNYRGYCLEHGIYTRDYLDLKAVEDDYTGHVFYKGYSKEKRNNLELALLYGWQSGKDIMDPEDTGFTLSSRYVPGKKYNRDDWYIATQMICWEIQQDYRNDNLEYNYKTVNDEKVHKSLKYASGKNISIYHYRNIFKGATGKDQPAYDIYRFMIDAMQAHGKITVPLDATKASDAKTVTLVQEKDSADNPTNIWKAEIEDKGKYPVKKENMSDFRNIEIKSGKNKSKLKIVPFMKGTKRMYRITWTGKDANDAPDESEVYKLGRIYAAKEGSIKNNLLFWGRADYSGTVPDHHQTIVTGSKDPVNFYIKLKVGNVPVTPDPFSDCPEPEYFPEFEFPVSKEDLNPGWDGNKHTGMGDASLAATYNLYRDGELVDSITLDEYGSRGVLTDTPWSETEDFNKTTSAQREHWLPAADPADPPTLCCTIPYTRVEYDAEITYRIEEVRPDGRFIEPDSGVRNYTVKYHAASDDNRECLYTPTQWSDMEYTVNTSPMGYEDGTNTGTINDVTDTLTVKEQIFINDCYRGKITLTKSLENENVFDDEPLGGGMKKSTASYWKLYLKGGYEASRYIRFVKEADLADGTAVYRATRDTSGISNEATAMKIGSNGSMMIYDVPYGEYYMEEVACDDESFVKEKFEVVIEEHSKAYSADSRYDHRYDYDIRDKKIANKIQIVKTDGETGKKVTAGKGAKFRIRYMGNQLLVNPLSAKNSGRLLPNAPAINLKTGYNDEFACDENGVITIPYQLKFGTYRLEEFNVPEGYYIGKYDKDGNPSSADYGLIGEYGKDHNGKVAEYTVPIYDSEGKRVEYKAEDDIFNYYTFKVEKQDMHTDGNFGQRVDCDGNITQADPSYDNEDYPYLLYYRTTAMANQPVKGKLELTKSGEELSGWEQITENGREFLRPVFEGVKKLKGAVYGLFAAEDILLNDGNEGLVIYDADTGERLHLSVIERTHKNSRTKDVPALLEKIYSADIFETGLLEHNSGASLWSMTERKNSEHNIKRSMYVTPEQKNTTYAGGWTTLDEATGTRYRYDVYSEMKYKAGGENETLLKVLKTTIPDKGKAVIGTDYEQDGVMLRKGETEPELMLGLDAEGNPAAVTLGSYGGTGEDILNYTYETYIFGTKGETGPDWNGNYIDFSAGTPKRYVAADYEPEYVTADEENGQPVVIPAGYSLKGTLTAGEKLIVTDGTAFKVRTKGNVWTDCYEDGTIIRDYKIEPGWSEVPYEGEGTHYVIETDGTLYKVLLEDKTWVECDEKGDFETALAELFTIRCNQGSSSDKGFGFVLDLFKMTSYADGEGKAREALYVFNAPEKGRTDCGVGYVYEEADDTTIVKGREPYAPIYYLSRDNIRTEMYYFGGQLKAYVTIPAAAVRNMYEQCIPELHFCRTDGESGKVERIKLDWFKNLGADNKTELFTPVSGIKIKAEYITGGKDDPYYTLEVLSDKGETAPVTLTYADGYTASMYCSTAASGNGVGVMELSGEYRTKGYTRGELIQLLTTDEDGKIVTGELPLGKYLLKEIAAPQGYVTSDRVHNFELKYKDQFTPIVWGENKRADNELFSVEIDLKKVFETSYNSRDYRPGEGAVFGIYKDDDKTIPITTLTVDENGISREKLKLPYGKYFLKEISVKGGYSLSDIPYYFEVNEAFEDISKPLELEYEEDAVEGKLYIDSYGKAVIDLITYDRFKAPAIVLDGTAYLLDQDFFNIHSEGKIVLNKVNAAFAHTKVSVTEDTEFKLPNGKVLKVKSIGNGYEYELDGMTGRYEMEASYTGAYGKTEREFIPQWDKVFPYTCKKILPGEDVMPPAGYTMKTSEAGEKAIAQKGENKKIYMVRVENPDDPMESIWKNSDMEGNVLPEYLPETEHIRLFTPYKTGSTPAVTEIEIIHIPETVADGERLKGVTGADGKQKYTHMAVINNGLYTISQEERIVFEEGNVIGGENGGEYEICLDKEGNLKIDLKSYIRGAIDEAGAFRAELEGEVLKSEFAKNVTLKRQTSSAGSLMVKINSEDNFNNGGIRNDKTPPEPVFPYTPPPASQPDVSIETQAYNRETGTGIAFAGKDVEIDDKVSYKGLKASEEYTVKGILVDKETGDPVKVNGKPITAEKTFTPEGTEGSVIVSFKLDATELKNRSVVAFETLYMNDKEIASHKDINDENQTVVFPMIETKARGEKTGEHIALAEKNTVITDTVSYSNLPEGTYMLTGILMDKETGKAVKINGEKVSSVKEFTVYDGRRNETEEILFIFDSRGLKGKSLVVFETLQLKDTGYTVAEHKDIDDKEQSVTIPEIRTKAAPVKKGVIADTISYRGLIPGLTYCVIGTVVDKADGVPVSSDGEVVSARVSFVPDKADGEVEVTFRYSEKDLDGLTVVIFEEIYLDGELIGEHKDLEDKNQTVEFEIEKPDKGTPKTGDETRLLLWAVLMAVAVAGIMFLMTLRDGDKKK